MAERDSDRASDAATMELYRLYQRKKEAVDAKWWPLFEQFDAEKEAKTAHGAGTRTEPKTRHRAASYDRGVQIAAARLRLVTDRQLGLETPDWVKKLAASEPHTRVS